MTISSTRFTVDGTTIELCAPSVDPQRVSITANTHGQACDVAVLRQVQQ